MLKTINIVSTVPKIFMKNSPFFSPNKNPNIFSGIMNNIGNTNNNFFNFLRNFFFLGGSKLASIYIFLITTLKRKKLKMKKHHSWKRWRKNKVLRKSILK